MSNVRTFLWLFVDVQIGFILLDAYQHWKLARERGVQGVIGRYRALILAVVVACLAYFTIQFALASLLPPVERIANFAIRSAHVNLKMVDLRWSVPVFVSVFLAGSLFDYLVHRFLLHGVLWRLHENHHLPSVVSNVMPGIAARPYVVVPNFLINTGSCAVVFTLVRMLGRPDLIATFIYIIPALLLAFAFVASASHSIFLRRYEWSECVFRTLLLITPREHLVHHAAHLEGNYGNFTVIWDRAFGTYIPPKQEPFDLGLAYDQDFLGAITASLLKLSPAARSRCEIAQVCNLDPQVPTPE
jgi:sterol desaturase/sphingolipid hydroxylase (fatty acid hydroxylase superfamily)